MNFQRFFKRKNLDGAEKLYERLLDQQDYKDDIEEQGSKKEDNTSSWGATKDEAYDDGYLPTPGKCWWYSQYWKLLNNLTFGWIDPLIKYGSENVIEQDDLLLLPKALKSSNLLSAFKDKWESYKGEESPQARLIRSLYETVKAEMWVSGLFRLVCEVCGLLSPLVLKQLVLFMDGESSWIPNKQSASFILPGLLLLIASVQALSLQQFIHGVFLAGAKLNATALLFIYEKNIVYFVQLDSNNKEAGKAKGLRVRRSAAAAGTARGRLAGLQGKDPEKLRQFVVFAHNLWAAPFTAVGTVILLISLLGRSALAGAALVPLLVPLETRLATAARRRRKDAAKASDERLGRVGEGVAGARALKLACLEEHHVGRVGAARARELRAVGGALRLDALNQAILRGGPILAALLSFAAFALDGHVLTPDVAFASLALFNALMHPFITLPKAVSLLADFRVAIDRLATFLEEEEVVAGPTHVRDLSSAPSLTVDHASFGTSRDPGEGFWLKEVAFAAAPGLTAVVGRVGAGKSLLLDGLLNELDGADRARVVLRAAAPAVAYCPAEPWVLHATLRENVVRGAPGWEVDEPRFRAALAACELEEDLAAWPAGAGTVVGDRGLQLSGGQRARVALARALYARPQVALLDDPLCSVDARTARRVAERALVPLARGGAVVVLATHQPQLIRLADRVVVLEEGRVRAQGTYQEILDMNLDLSAMIEEDFGEEEEAADESKDETPEAEALNNILPEAQAPSPVTSSQSKAVPILKDDRQRGAVRWAVYFGYAQACGSWILAFGAVALSLGVHMANVSKEFVLAAWAENSDKQATYLPVYAGICVGVSILNLVRFTVVFGLALRAASNLHNRLLKAVTAAQPQFFDQTPAGRITSRFSSDMDKIDTTIPATISSFLDTVLTMISALGVILYNVPTFAIVLLPICYIYYWVSRYYRASSKELKRLDNSTKSPIFSHFHESMDGLSSIRAYHIQARMIEEYSFLVDDQLKARLCWDATNRWLGIRIDFLGCLIVFFAALLAVRFSGNDSSAGKVGLAVTYAITVTKTLSFGLRAVTNMQNHFNSVERVQEYAALPPERRTVARPAGPLPPGWPAAGSISVRDVHARHRPGLPLVLRDVALEVGPGELLGVCGRTGCGKSTLVAALVRMLEVESGKILIDGIDIGSVPLKKLRSKITVIPQDAHIFSGTLREVLDPVGAFPESALWDILEQLEMKDTILSMPKGLDSNVAAKGSNWSAGQQQLFGIARSLLRGSPIFIFDEASARVDREGAEAIARALGRLRAAAAAAPQEGSAGRRPTAVVVAHRLTDLVGCDRVVVMDAGRVVEVGAPAALLASPGGAFAGLAAQLGPALARDLRARLLPPPPPPPEGSAEEEEEGGGEGGGAAGGGEEEGAAADKASVLV